MFEAVHSSTICREDAWRRAGIELQRGQRNTAPASRQSQRPVLTARFLSYGRPERYGTRPPDPIFIVGSVPRSGSTRARSDTIQSHSAVEGTMDCPTSRPWLHLGQEGRAGEESAVPRTLLDTNLSAAE